MVRAALPEILSNASVNPRGGPALAMLLTGFCLFILTLGDVINNTSEYFKSESYWVIALWNIFGILVVWFVWMLAMLYFLARVTSVAEKQLKALSQCSSSLEARAYANVLIEKDSIRMEIVKQRWSLSRFYGGALTVVLAFVFVWVQSQSWLSGSKSPSSLSMQVETSSNHSNYTITVLY